MPAYFSLVFDLKKQNKDRLFIDFISILQKEGFVFKSGYWNSEGDSLEDIIKWNTTKLCEDFEIAIDENYTNDYKQICWDYHGFSETRLFIINRKDAEDVEFHIIIPEDDFIRFDEGVAIYDENVVDDLKRLSENIWESADVLSIQTYLELSDGNVSWDDIKRGYKPSAEPFAIVSDEDLNNINTINTKEAIMKEVEAIMERHSVRNYLDKPIEEDKVKALKEKIDELNDKGNLKLQFCEEAGNTFNRLLNKVMGLGSAPSVIACVGKEDDTLEERVGYYGEQLVLFAQTLGLNTCWAGTYNPKNVPIKLEDGEKLVIVIAIGYGANQGRERKSKNIEQVANIKGSAPKWFTTGVKMALLAPTAINQQKFEIVLNNDGTVSFVDKGGVHSKTDLGIVKYHFEVGAQYAKNSMNS